jgi:hypothetical protein
VTSRTSKRRVAGLAVVGTLALSGCTLHPGSAAVVNGSDISQSKVDSLVLAACSFSKVQRISTGGASPQTSMAFLRQQLLQSLITFRITNKAATQLHLTVSPAAIAKITATQPVPGSLGSSEQKLLKQFFYDSDRSQLQVAVIGAHIKNPSVTNADNVTPTDQKAAAKYLAAFTARQQVEVSPAFGTWSNGALVRTDGSLSAPVSAAALKWVQLRSPTAQGVLGIPPSQVCG